VTKLRTEKSRIRNPTGSRDLAVLRNFQSGSYLSYSLGTGVLSRRLKRFSPSRLEDKNAWRCTSTPPIYMPSRRGQGQLYFTQWCHLRVCVCVYIGRYVCVRIPCGCCDNASRLVFTKYRARIMAVFGCL
jgi:hypothetical protein